MEPTNGQTAMTKMTKYDFITAYRSVIAAFVILIIIYGSSSLISGCAIDPDSPQGRAEARAKFTDETNGYDAVNKVTYDGHTYLHFEGGSHGGQSFTQRTLGIVHDPDCKHVDCHSQPLVSPRDVGRSSEEFRSR